MKMLALNHRLRSSLHSSSHHLANNLFIKLTYYLVSVCCLHTQNVATTNIQLAAVSNSSANIIIVNKCCEKYEIHVDGACMPVNQTEYFQPKFTSYDGKQNIPVRYKFAIGLPACGSMQVWPIYHYEQSSDKLELLDDGKLRHYTNTEEDLEAAVSDYIDMYNSERVPFHHDYANGLYCIDKALNTLEEYNGEILFAKICLAKKDTQWHDTTFLVRKILNPIFHGISLILLVIIAIVYFILPTLRDLVGNIITTIAVCLMIAQAADLVRIFSEFENHVSFIVADIILNFSLLGSFFWLNSLGYYIWKTFRSRNVFLRVTDGKKYCYYSMYTWSITILLTATAVFAHFFLDADATRAQDTMGLLGNGIFFAAIACTIIIDIFFYVTTLKLINRRNVYGRIQHKLKANFIMYALMLLVLSVWWLFLTLSWLQLDAFLYAHIIVNALQTPLLLYICVLRQKHVTFLLKKSCCYNEPPSSNDWGDEMHYMNCNEY